MPAERPRLPANAELAALFGETPVSVADMALRAAEIANSRPWRPL
jgi:hypothetical protein